MSGQVIVVAILSPAPGKEEQVRDGLKDLAEKVHANEQGALRYSVTEQTNGDGPNEFVVIERYADQAAYEAHTKTDYYNALAQQAQAESLLSKPLDIKIVSQVAGFER